MKSSLDQFAYQEYARRHHDKLLEVATNERRLRGARARREQDPSESLIRPGFGYRLAYVAVVVILIALMAAPIVVAAINASSGGGGSLYLVR